MHKTKDKVLGTLLDSLVGVPLQVFLVAIVTDDSLHLLAHPREVLLQLKVSHVLLRLLTLAPPGHWGRQPWNTIGMLSVL